MCKHENSKLSSEAKKVYKKWKEHIIKNVDRPLIEVKCDLKTTNFRKTARQMLSNALSCTELHYKLDKDTTSKKETTENKDNSKSKDKISDESVKAAELAEYIERELYKVTNRMINKSYKRTIRKLCFSIKHQKDLRKSVWKNKLSVCDLVKKFLQA